MRAGASTVQQALTTEAATLVKQSLCLARRRGHAQVTPLHVASAMLSSPAGLLRAACLRSHSYPLQCKALELCFSVALNRLPATSSFVPLLGHHLNRRRRLHAYHHPPAISNSLVAVFKRAQAHRRRGLAESQQPPLLAAKVELEQLIVSILDDPSVSRVMREAGFSSSQVKADVEKASIPSDSPLFNNKCMESEDMASSVLEILAGRKKRSVAVVAESLSSSRAAVRRLMEMVSRGEVPENVRGVQFISIELSSFVSMSIFEVQQKVSELRRHVRSCCSDRGAALYIGDLDWAAEYWSGSGSGSGERRRRSSFCPVESVVREISKLVLSELSEEISNGGFLWLLSSATQQGYMRCRAGDPSLEILLGLHPLAVHGGSLDIFLNNGSDMNSPVNWGIESQDGSLLGDGNEFQSETNPSSAAVTSCSHGQISCNLPSWLQVPLEDKRKEYINDDDQDSSPPKDQCRYWNFMGSSGSNRRHQHRLERTLSFSSASPVSFSCCEQKSFTWPFSAPTSRASSPEHANPNSTSSSDAMDVDYVSRFRELSAKNLKILCSVLETVVPCHKEIIPDIASTVLQCRSGMLRRKERPPPSSQRKEDTWLLFEGNDCEGKEKIAMELANVIFGSLTSFVSINAGRFSVEQFFVSLRDNPHCVILVRDAEQLDYDSRISIKEAVEGGRTGGFGGEEDGFGDAIVILSCENSVSRSRARSPVNRKLGDDGEKEEEGGEIRSRVCLDLNLLSEDEMNCLELDDAGLLVAVDGVFLLEIA